MTQYIEKSTLVAEIERRKQVALGWMETAPNDAIEAEFELCDDILSFIDTLEVKEIPETTHIEHKKIKKLCEIQRYDEDGKAYSVMLPDSRLFMNKINDVIDAIDNIDSRLQMVEQKIGE